MVPSRVLSVCAFAVLLACGGPTRGTTSFGSQGFDSGAAEAGDGSTATTSAASTSTGSNSETGGPGTTAGSGGESSSSGVAPTEPDAMVLIPAGPFMMGCLGPPSPHCWVDEEPFHAVMLSAYTIDRLEVTVQQYEACVAEGGCDPVTPADGSNPSYPMAGVTWEQASAYCVHVGKQLPTEAQWEKAARGGGDDDRAYPWGDTEPTCAVANWAPCGEALVEVGSYPAGASPYGVLDMAGGVWEWVHDWYGETYYASSPAADPTGPDTGAEHVFKGGSYRSDHFSRLGIARRFIGSQGGDFTDRRGIRCAAPA